MREYCDTTNMVHQPTHSGTVSKLGACCHRFQKGILCQDGRKPTIALIGLHDLSIFIDFAGTPSLIDRGVGAAFGLRKPVRQHGKSTKKVMQAKAKRMRAADDETQVESLQGSEWR